MICKNTIVRVLLAVALTLPPMATSLAADAGIDDAPTPEQVRAAVDGGLKWLLRNQGGGGKDAGSWPSRKYQTAVASLAGLAFLANGHTPGKGPEGEALERAMAYVQASMTPEGYLGARDQSMYVHAISSLFGLSYLGLTKEPERERELAVWCAKSVKLIVEAQQVRRPRIEQGGWRYNPYGRESDLSVTSWQLAVLHAARQCGYEIEDRVVSSALAYVNSAFVAERDEQAGFLYRPGVSKVPEPAVTGVALYVKSILEPEPDERLARAREFVRQHPPTWGGPQYNGYFFFGSFYLVQGMFQLGDEAWAPYAAPMQKVLVERQTGDGHWEFPPDNKGESREAGHAYTTAMAVLILSLEKQYLPMYQRQKKLF